MLYLFNSPILTEHGIYDFSGPCDLAVARFLIAGGFESAIGHTGAAEVLSSLLGVHIPAKRQAVHMQVGDRALTLRMLERLPEGRVLSADELRNWPHELALLERIV